MKMTGWIFGAVCAALMAGCSHSSNGVAGVPGPNSSKAVATAEGPTRPAATADDNTWGNYLSQQGKLHAKDAPGHPYIYVVPAGDSAEATARRQSEVDSIEQSIGPILIPGSLLIIGGPEGDKTNAFVAALGKQLKEKSLAGIVVLVVSDNDKGDSIQQALKASGADVRFAAM